MADLYSEFTRRFEQLGVPYMITGSVAAMIYSEPRLTNDLDIVIDLDARGALRLSELFPLSEFYCPPTEVILSEIIRERRGHFNIMHTETGFKADVYLRGNDPLHIWALERRKRIKVGDLNVFVAPVEYVIIRKLEFFREGQSEKHLRDIRAVLDIARESINFSVLEPMLADRNLLTEWERAKTVPM